MRTPPRPPDSPLLDRPSLWFIGAGGAAKALVVLVVLALLPVLGVSREITRITVFATLACGQLLFVYPVRRTDPPPLPNRILHLAIAGGFLAQIAVIQIRWLGEAFHTIPLSLAAWLAVAAASIAAWGAAELIALLLRRPNLKTFR